MPTCWVHGKYDGLSGCPKCIRRHKHYTLEEKNKILQLLREGASIEVIAKKMDRTYDAIRYNFLPKQKPVT